MNSVSRAIKLLIGKQRRKIQGDDNTPCECEGEDGAEHIEQRCVIKLFMYRPIAHKTHCVCCPQNDAHENSDD